MQNSICFNTLLEMGPLEIQSKQTKTTMCCRRQLNIMHFSYVSVVFGAGQCQKHNRNKRKTRCVISLGWTPYHFSYVSIVSGAGMVQKYNRNKRKRQCVISPGWAPYQFSYVSIASGAGVLQKYNRNKGINNVLLAPARHQIMFHAFQWSFEDEVIRNTIETNKKHTYHDQWLHMRHFPYVSIVFGAGGMQEHNRNKRNRSNCVEHGGEAEATRTVQMRRTSAETVPLRETERNRR